jgi:hypothetical protein
MRKLLILILVLGALLPSTAAAVTPTQDVYSRAATAGGGGSPNDPGGLPFSGLDVGIVLVAGALLVGTGLAIRRSARTD